MLVRCAEAFNITGHVFGNSCQFISNQINKFPKLSLKLFNNVVTWTGWKGTYLGTHGQSLP